MAKILVVYHSLSGNTKAAAEAVAEGARSVPGTHIILKTGPEATPEDLTECDGIAVGSYDAFSYMAGGLKDFFDRSFYPTQGQVTDKPYVAFVTHGGGGRAIKSVEDICTSFKFKKVAEPVLVRGKPDAGATARLKSLGIKLAQSC